MAAFQKGPQTSPKGSEIRVAGVAAEISRLRVIFKSSGNDKIICERTASTDITAEPRSGSPVTVVGRVRGRGMLGNVTLDQCRLVLPELASTPATEPPQQEPEEPATPSPAVAVEATAPAAEKIAEAAPVPDPVFTVAIDKPRRTPKTSAKAFASPPAEAVPQELLQSQESGQQSSPPPGECEPSKTTSADRPASASSGRAGIYYALTAIAGWLVALLVFVKSRLAATNGSRTHTVDPPTEETRRAALEALLLGQKTRN